MRILIITMAALIFTVSTTAASDEDGGYIAFGVGLKSCQAFVRDFHENKWSKVINIQWINGYLTAFNKFIYDGENVAENMDVAERERWILNYCNHNSAKDLEQATTELISHLLKPKKKSAL